MLFITALALLIKRIFLFVTGNYMKKLLTNPQKDGKISHPIAGGLRVQDRKNARAQEQN